MLAQATDTPELELSEDEGKSFMKAAQSVMRHYSVQTTQKTLDWVSFVGVSVSIYAPRVAAIGFRKRKERAETSEERPNVIHFGNGRRPASGGIHSTNPDDFTGGAAE